MIHFLTSREDSQYVCGTSISEPHKYSFAETDSSWTQCLQCIRTDAWDVAQDKNEESLLELMSGQSSFNEYVYSKDYQ